MMAVCLSTATAAPDYPQPGQSWSSLSCRNPAAACHNDLKKVIRPQCQLLTTRDNLGCLFLTLCNQLSGILPVEQVDKDT